MAKTLLERFEDKVMYEPNSGCWLWTASVIPDGYGMINVGGRKGRSMLAHRVSYELYKGPIPAGLDIDHLCRVRSCVNPNHLEAVSHSVNVLRGVVPGKVRANCAAITHCPRGHEYTPENTYINPNLRYKKRRCIICANFLRREKKREAKCSAS
jgi:hypothetical protein